MPNSFTMDDKDFRLTMQQYMRDTGKDMSDVANGKLRDWMFKAHKKSPRADRDDIKKVIENPKYIAWFANKIFGKGNWGRGGSQTKDETGESSDWAVAKKLLRRRLSAIGYAKSGWIKAAKSLPDPKGSRPGKQTGRAFKVFPQVKINIRKSRPQTKSASASDAVVAIAWPTSGGGDLSGKQKIADRALVEGRKAMVADTKQYLAKKAKKRADAISRKAAGAAKVLIGR